MRTTGGGLQKLQSGLPTIENASSGNRSSLLDLLSSNRLSTSLNSLAPQLDAELHSAIHQPGVTIAFLCVVVGLLLVYLWWNNSRREARSSRQGCTVQDGAAKKENRDESLGGVKGSAANGHDSACEENHAGDTEAVEGKVSTARKLRFSESHTSHHWYSETDAESKRFDPAEANESLAGLEQRSRAASSVSACSGVTGVSEMHDVWGQDSSLQDLSKEEAFRLVTEAHQARPPAEASAH
eukprot:TRINITY_DN22894_c0_g1_i1.p1 TRINITY_DN22894_c0_g1~~TRINITY_DN22894_c0_g1_i1.p1  ORF type:complete len:249 (-),score=37.02 TRINITY_DN22894_c0_g1_i1:60-779(-)